jgi:aminopeptidase YwaD
MKKLLMLLTLALAFPIGATAELENLISESTIRVIAEEVSGVSAKRNLDTITLYHRTRASSQFRAAAEHVLASLESYGLAEAEIIEYPADGQTMFGTQKSRLAWEVEFAELWELDGDGQRVKRYANWEAMPLSLAQDSVSGSATASLVDIGAGRSAQDYAGLDLQGKLVLTSSQPEAVAEKAVGELGAAGIISYAPNQKSAWWKENDQLVRWGHLDSFSKTKTFGFMISLGTARELQTRLMAGEDITFAAEVRAAQQKGSYSLVSARIAGTDPALSRQEIVYSCHLDHPRPGANDNASGCVSILEAARSLSTLIENGSLPAPKRSLRFIWPAEIEGTLIYLASLEDSSQLKANIHLDMVGGGEQTKSVFRISGGPMSLPTFIADVGHEIGHFVNEQTLLYASGKKVAFPLVSREGSKNPQLAVMEELSMGSDHDVFRSSSWGVPGLYLHDWPDRYIHTNFDTAAMIDPTKLKRAAFIAALQGWYLANFSEADVAPLLQLLRANALARARDQLLASPDLDSADRRAVRSVHRQVELGKVDSINSFAALDRRQSRSAAEFVNDLDKLLGVSAGKGANNSLGSNKVYSRNPAIKGTMHAFGYSYLQDHLSPERYANLSLGDEMAYEALNLVDGSRTVSDIRNWLVAEFGAANLADVSGYLAALAEIGVIE